MMTQSRLASATLCAAILAVACAQPAVAQQARVRPTTLMPVSGAPLDLALQLPTTLRDTETSWDNANVAECIVRSGGRQTSIQPQALAGDARTAAITLDHPGPALLCLSVGPPETRGHSDSWQRTTYCAKIVLDVQPGPEDRPVRFMPNPGITAKTGQKIEILPLIDPTIIRPGHDLPVRVYYEGEKVAGAELTATITDSSFGKTIDTIAPHHPTDSHGTTWFRVSRSGTWTIRFEHDVKPDDQPDAEPTHYTAELIFQIGQGDTR